MDLSSPCRAVKLTVAALGLTPNYKHVDLMVGEQMKPEFLAINPEHTVPTLVDGDLVMWERWVCLNSINQFHELCICENNIRNRNSEFLCYSFI